ncbi:2Fe-2S iron-sulfur cluster-binding protein [Nitrospirillum amazonense]|uniref:2Fe-2S ferredoxin n=1 Tax=Nitrospirillum amazonense TaxID=28077 RepID=A0A560JHJ4_9PROT|nr:2Fe-2S iron-sulfur cluster-binding protein [Nitrospirillum amazonense]MDG3439585.1 2Fe-2S iron-sulfur cluster-binding protein [Nitrospirillum amazonense]TWB70632.1 2Fe-2S ferredoxin [Nitrospirillum amazonense]
MPIITVVSRDGTGRAVEMDTGTTLMEGLRDHGFDEVLAMCGGCCSCATCHVYVEPASTATEEEDELLALSAHRRDTSRLSCQITLTPDHDGLRVEIPPED